MELSQKIMSYAVRLLSRRRYAINALKKKLIQKFVNEHGDPETGIMIDKTITRLVELKYLNDEEFADLFIHDQLRSKPQGIRMIENRLRQKGIEEATISSALTKQQINEDELITQAITKKITTIKNVPALKQKQKLFRFLASRGFNTADIVKNLSLYKTAPKG